MARKSKPWAVVLICDDGARVRTEHRTQPEAYRKVNAERADAEAGTTRVIAIRVEQWQPSYGTWCLYENAYPEEP